MKMCRWIAALLLLSLVLCACGAKPIADGSYTVDVSMSGGTGKAKILSPAQVEVMNGQMTATFIWSSKNYDYMIVDGVKYEPVTYEGGSTFQIPLKDLKELPIIGDTIAMSTPHEIEYTLTFGALEAAK